MRTQGVYSYQEYHPGYGAGDGTLKDMSTCVLVEMDELQKNMIIFRDLENMMHVLLFSISNYFRKFSLEYKRQHNNIQKVADGLLL